MRPLPASIIVRKAYMISQNLSRSGFGLCLQLVYNNHYAKNDPSQLQAHSLAPNAHLIVRSALYLALRGNHYLHNASAYVGGWLF